MNNKVMAACIAVVVVVVVAVAALYVADSGDDSSQDPGYRTDFVVGDYITHEISEDGSLVTVKRTVTEIDSEGVLFVLVEYGDEDPSTIPYTAEQFSTFMGSHHAYPTDLEPETVTYETRFGTMEVQVYTEEVDGTAYTTYMSGSVVYYEQEVKDGATESTELVDTTLFDSADSVAEPDISAADVELRTDLEVGDYITVSESKVESGFVRTVYVRYQITQITSEGYRVQDTMRSTVDTVMTQEEYLGLILYSGDLEGLPTQTICTNFGQVLCCLVSDGDTTTYVGAEDRIIYRTSSGDSYTLLDGTTLFDRFRTFSAGAPPPRLRNARAVKGF